MYWLPAAKTRRKIAIGIAVACFLAIPVLAYQLRLHAGSFLVCSDRPQPADLILVIGGDFWGPRVLKGADLAVQGYAPFVLICGPPYQRDRSEAEFAIDFLTAKGYPRELFQAFGHHAGSTVAEAIVVGSELRRRKVHRVILVTASYHSRRADIVFRLFCPGVHFISVPAPDPHYDPEHWRTDPESRRLFFSECEKIMGTVLLAYPKHLLGLDRAEP
jgi:uncharacterized SAM-binding protein YcdF (DUF218 family)